MRHTQRIRIACSPDELFRVLMDPTANKQWQTGVVATWSAGRPGEVGQRMHEVREFAGYRTTIVYQLVAAEWGRRANVELVEGPLRGSAAYEVRQDGQYCDLTVTFEVTTSGRWRYVARALGAILVAEMALSCDRLRALLEREHEPARSPRVLSPV